MKREVDLRKLDRMVGIALVVGRWFLPIGVGLMLLVRIVPVFEGGSVAMVKGASLTGIPLAVQLVMIVWSFALCVFIFINSLRGLMDLLLMWIAFFALKMACYPVAVALSGKSWEPWDIWIAYFIFAISLPIAIHCFRSKAHVLDLRTLAA